MDEYDSRRVKESLAEIESKLERIEKQLKNINEELYCSKEHSFAKMIKDQLNYRNEFSFASEMISKQTSTISILNDILYTLKCK